ncbi:hypothetical protein [Streptomyces sp. NPDC046805]|uniref:hypothetical protein n=1 Tax=Streptomyces sp. NPDC046805 TaxID=3155134 RepID=UPI0033D701D6
MPRGRHRHSPPLHRLLPPSAIAGLSLVCALSPWVFSETMVLRSLAAAAAATAVVGAVVMRRWDTQAGKQVADLTRARASDEWRHEERIAELEADLDESRDLRLKLEQRLRAKRTELTGLRNEHAALLRRYATAETERASALEGRRLLELEAVTPSRALPPGSTTTPDADAEAEAESAAVAASASADTAEPTPTDEESAAPAVFSPDGSQLFLRAKVALSRFGEGDFGEGESDEGDSDEGHEASSTASSADRSVPKGDGVTEAVAEAGASGAKTARAEEPAQKEPAEELSAQKEPAQEDEAEGQHEAADGHEHAAAGTTTAQAPSAPSAQPAQQPAGHFTVPTAVAVAPAAPVRRPAAGGGFDFFGTHKGDDSSGALDAVHNEDLADVVGQEALALHKAESETAYKPADAEPGDAGQVIDLTAHDETESIDLQGLRSAAS